MIEKWGKLKISEMTTQHIKNCIKALMEDRIMITEMPFAEDKMYFLDCKNDMYIQAFKEELKKREEMLED